MDDQQERVIVGGLREGKTEAWQALYDAYAGRVWHGIARLLGSNSADVADVVQETMMAAARSVMSFDPGRGTLWLWLWGIARRKLAHHFRSENRHHRLAQAGAWLAAGNGRLLRWLDGTETTAPPEETAELAT